MMKTQTPTGTSLDTFQSSGEFQDRTMHCVASELTQETCKYIKDMTASNRVTEKILIQIATYVTKIFTAFGLIGRRNGDDWLLNLDTETASHGIGTDPLELVRTEATMRPVLQALSDFRKQVRYVLDVSLCNSKIIHSQTLQEMALKFEEVIR